MHWALLPKLRSQKVHLEMLNSSHDVILRLIVLVSVVIIPFFWSDK